ncbi:MAG: hypothetical protein ACI9J2_001529 [Saprospiraceae bacterium]|jgi:hypothetical protein
MMGPFVKRLARALGGLFTLFFELTRWVDISKQYLYTVVMA